MLYYVARRDLHFVIVQTKLDRARRLSGIISLNSFYANFLNLRDAERTFEILKDGKTCLSFI